MIASSCPLPPPSLPSSRLGGECSTGELLLHVPPHLITQSVVARRHTGYSNNTASHFTAAPLRFSPVHEEKYIVCVHACALFIILHAGPCALCVCVCSCAAAGMPVSD